MSGTYETAPEFDDLVAEHGYDEACRIVGWLVKNGLPRELSLGLMMESQKPQDTP